MKRVLYFVGVIAMALSGCASTGSIKHDGMIGTGAMQRHAEEQLREQPSVVRVPLQREAFQLNEPIFSLPAEKNVPVNAEYSEAEIEHILHATAAASRVNLVYRPDEGRRIVANENSTATPGFVGGEERGDRGRGRKKVSIRFSGSLRDFLASLSQASGYFFRWENNSIVVREKETFNMVVPTYPELLKEVEANLRALGADDVAYDRFTSTITFRAGADQIAQIREFCKKVRENASLVTMRILLVNVRLTGEENTGIDWTKVVAGLRSQKVMKNFGLRSDEDNGTSSTTTLETVAANTFKDGVGLLFSSTGASLFVESANFSLSALLNFIDSYGRYNIVQNIFVESLSGTKGRLDVLTETPYVSEVSFSALSQQITTPTQAVKTAMAKSGVEIEITPYYSRKDGSLSIALKVNVLGVTRFISLDAGQQIGRITQPETTRKGVDTFLRMSPAHVAVIGGLVIERNNSLATGLPGDNYFSKAVKNEREKEELVLVVKPTIIEFVDG